MVPAFADAGEVEVDSLDEGDLHRHVPDLLPEYYQYKDEGCDLAGSCLNCPFPQCVYEQPGGKKRWLKKRRDREITRLFADDGKAVGELAVMFGISQRTVQRALRDSLR
jgi:hypothetical protein